MAEDKTVQEVKWKAIRLGAIGQPSLVAEVTTSDGEVRDVVLPALGWVDEMLVAAERRAVEIAALPAQLSALSAHAERTAESARREQERQEADQQALLQAESDAREMERRRQW